MRNLIRTIVVLVMFGSRATIAQTVGSATSSAHSASATVPLLLTQNTRLIGAPVGHRQPHARDVPSENAADLEHIGYWSGAVCRKLNILRGCGGYGRMPAANRIRLLGFSERFFRLYSLAFPVHFCLVAQI